MHVLPHRRPRTARRDLVSLGKISDQLRYGRQATRIAEALENGLAAMRRSYVDRTVLSVEYPEPSDMRAGPANRGGHSYYPFEMLPACEQRAIKPSVDATCWNGKTYVVWALVDADVGNGMHTYPSAGVEQVHRIHSVPFLNELRPESSLLYDTHVVFYGTPSELHDFSLRLAKAGMTTSMLNTRTAEGIREYHAVTRRLMEKAGIYAAVQRMDENGYVPEADTLLAEVRARTWHAK